jgi:hypothetical protein
MAREMLKRIGPSGFYWNRVEKAFQAGSCGVKREMFF